MPTARLPTFKGYVFEQVREGGGWGESDKAWTHLGVNVLWAWRTGPMSVVGSGHMGTPPACKQTDTMTDRHDWKHYLPASSLAGGKIMCLIEFNSFDKAGVCTSAWKPSRPGSSASFFSRSRYPPVFDKLGHTCSIVTSISVLQIIANNIWKYFNLFYQNIGKNHSRNP